MLTASEAQALRFELARAEEKAAQAQALRDALVEAQACVELLLPYLPRYRTVPVGGADLIRSEPTNTELYERCKRALLR
jgi:hypothetical protein